MIELNTTLLLIIKNNKILLAKKKRGFGKGKFNGVGGKVKQNETIVEAMLRETKEEIGVDILTYKKMGFIVFNEFYKGNKTKLNMTIFTSDNYKGKISESEEMEPFWFDVNDIPYNNMNPDDKYWLPKLLNGKQFKAYFEISIDDKIIDYKIEEIK